MTTFYRFDIMKNLRIFQFGIVVLLCGILSLPLSAQTEVMAWSNITGVRVDGELIDFESSLRVGNLERRYGDYWKGEAGPSRFPS